MAPPLDRRPGFDKRAQFGIFTSYVAAGLGALVGLILLIVSLLNPTAFAFARTAAADAVSPAGESSAVTRSTGNTVLHVITGYIEAGSKNAELKEELQRARSKLAQAAAIEAENERLKRLLDIRESDDETIAFSRLIGSTATSGRRFALINAGAPDGIRIGQPVRSPIGLVGRVLEVGQKTARVLLVTDGESIVPVRRVKGNIAGFAQGQSDGTVRIRLIEIGINPLEPGDVLVTSGSGGLYRPGVPVALVQEILKDGAIARIISDPAATEFVAVEPVWQPIVERLPSQAGAQ